MFVLPYLRAPTPLPAIGQPLDVLSLNVFRRSDGYARVVEYVRGERPDVAVFVEATAAWRAGLAPLADVLPYEAYAPGAGSNGILIRSRVPLLRSTPLALGGQPQGALSVLISPHGHPVELLGIHLEWPMTPAAAASRNRELATLASYAANARLPLIAIGDFNATRYTPPFMRMLRAGRFVDAAAGTGLHGTWPVGFAPGWLQIDHCLHTAGVTVDRFAVGPFVGSDHYPLRVRLRVPDSSVRAGVASTLADARLVAPRVDADAFAHRERLIRGLHDLHLASVGILDGDRVGVLARRGFRDLAARDRAGHAADRARDPAAGPGADRPRDLVADPAAADPAEAAAPALDRRGLDVDDAGLVHVPRGVRLPARVHRAA